MRRVALAVSLLVSVGLVVLWVASCVKPVSMGWRPSEQFSVSCLADSGGVSCFYMRELDPAGRTEWMVGPWPSAGRLSFGAFSWNKRGNWMTGFLCPIWALLVCTLAYPGIRGAVWVLRRRRRVKNGLCLQCGYPREGVVGDRCPECGRRAAREWMIL